MHVHYQRINLNANMHFHSRKKRKIAMMDKNERAEWLKKKLDALNMPAWGRAAEIAKATGASHPAANGWVHGKLPRDLNLAVKFCSHYRINMQEWVTGRASANDIEPSSYEKAFMLARDFEKQTGDLTNQQFLAVVDLLLTDGSGGELAAANLGKMATIFNLSEHKQKVNGGTDDCNG